jgi:AraC-like DNA-binding protein
MDPLSDLLGALRLESSMISMGFFTAPWAVSTEPLSFPVFHAVLEGQAWLLRPGEPLLLGPGDVVVLASGDGHCLSSAPAGVSEVSVRSLPRQVAPGGAVRVEHGGGGSLTRILCGTFRMQHAAAEGLLSLLPRVLRLPTAGPELAATLQLMAAELTAFRPGAAAAITRLIDLLFIHLLRREVADLPTNAQGLLGALGDAQVAQAMTLMHRRPAEGWSVASLADQVGLSRSSFAARFTERVGLPPLAYLTRWRIHTAARLLQDDRLSTAEVAERVGYSAEDAFVRAFRRVMGVTPSVWRRERLAA